MNFPEPFKVASIIFAVISIGGNLESTVAIRAADNFSEHFLGVLAPDEYLKHFSQHALHRIWRETAWFLRDKLDEVHEEIDEDLLTAYQLSNFLLDVTVLNCFLQHTMESNYAPSY